MNDIIVVLLIVAVCAAAIAKIVIDKKNGRACSGCPHAKNSKCNCKK